MRNNIEFFGGIILLVLVELCQIIFFGMGYCSLFCFLMVEVLVGAAIIYMTWKLVLPYKRLLNYFSQNKKEEQKASPEKKDMKSPVLQDIQLTLLTEQINPHFLYNTLESIRGQALYHDDFVVADMAETLGTFFRYSISRKGNIVTLNDEILNVQIYLKIQQFRFQNKFSLNIIMEDELAGEYQMPKLTLQPIVENSLVHGLDTSKEGGCITIRIIETENKLMIFIKDNGCGIPSDKLKIQNQNLAMPYYNTTNSDTQKRGGIALYNINNRLKLMYGEQYGLRLYSTEDVGTEVEIVLPKIKEEKMRGMGYEKGTA